MSKACSLLEKIFKYCGDVSVFPFFCSATSDINVTLTIERVILKVFIESYEYLVNSIITVLTLLEEKSRLNFFCSIHRQFNFGTEGKSEYFRNKAPFLENRH